MITCEISVVDNKEKHKDDISIHEKQITRSLELFNIPSNIFEHFIYVSLRFSSKEVVDTKIIGEILDFTRMDKENEMGVEPSWLINKKSDMVFSEKRYMWMPSSIFKRILKVHTSEFFNGIILETKFTPIKFIISENFNSFE